jgi:hypothetical protein
VIIDWAARDDIHVADNVTKIEGGDVRDSGGVRGRAIKIALAALPQGGEEIHGVRQVNHK